MVMSCYVDEDFAGLWRHKNSQDNICNKIRTLFVLTFSNCTLLWISKLQNRDGSFYPKILACGVVTLC